MHFNLIVSAPWSERRSQPMVPGQATNGAWYLDHVLLQKSAFPSKVVLLAGVLSYSKQTIGIVIIITTGYGPGEPREDARKCVSFAGTLKSKTRPSARF
jgi:hypothetical protein